MSVAGPSRRVLVDTSAYYALTDRTERTHRDAAATRDRLSRERWRLFTTNFILAETHALILHRLVYRLALEVLQEIDRSTTTLIRVRAADEQTARLLLATYDDKTFSLTDALSFVVMERLRIATAFTFDRDFLRYGLPAITS